MHNPGVFHREKRHPSQMYHPMHHSVANYWTEPLQKREMKHDFNDDLFLNNIHLIPDPLKKNLADSLFNIETSKKPEKIYQQNQKMNLNSQKEPLEKPPKQSTTFGGIGSFFSGVMNVLSNVMFRTRPTNYYDCFDVDSQGQAWQHARTDVQDKNGQAGECESRDGPPNPNVSSEMNFDSRVTVTGCERKLNQVLQLLAPKQVSSPVWVRKRPKKVFVEPGSVSESFEDAFSPEDFCSLPNDSYIEYYSPLQHHCEELYETAAQKTKLNMAPVEENTDIVNNIMKTDLEFKKDYVQSEPEKVKLEKDDMQLKQEEVLEQQKMQFEEQKVHMGQQEMQLDQEQQQLEHREVESSIMKDQLVSSCEDKLSRLKELLQEKRMKCRTKQEVPDMSQDLEASRATPPKTEHKEMKTADKRFKNPNRRCGKRTKSKLKCHIEDDLVFASEISVGTPPSTENSPMQHNVSFGDYFDEVSGRFRTASTCSDDSFQIVFNDCQTGRLRKSSDCDSEDSFIVFEDSPESCYVSNDVFDSDSESEVSDSGCGITCKLAPTLTRTISNLADDSLFVSEDEVDFGTETVVDEVEVNTGLLIDEKKKQLRKCQPSKKVHFSSAPPKVHVMRVWTFAARQARAGHWERYAVDRERFKRRIADMDMALSWVLKPQHRRRVMFQRFMPWWNQLKRKELAEKKEKEEEEKRKEEQRQKEEARLQEEQQNEDDNLKGEEELETETAEDVNVKESREEEYKGKQEEKPKEDKLETQTAKDVNLNEHTADIDKENKVKEENNDAKENLSNEDGSMILSTGNKNFNDSPKNKDNVKISTNLIISDDAQIAKKIQDLEVSDKNSNIEVVSS